MARTRKRHTAPPRGVQVVEDPRPARVYTIAELVERWRVDRHTVALEIRRGNLKGFKAGGQYRVFEADVLSYEQRPHVAKAAS